VYWEVIHCREPEAEMRKLLHALIGCVIMLSSWSVYCQEQTDVLFQFSTIDALLQGLYEGGMSFADLKIRGDFGLGTFHRLDGEMIGLDGAFYQVKSDGTVCHVSDEMMTPFAVVTFFEPDETRVLEERMDLDQIEMYLDALVPTKNIFYAVKIEGQFLFVKTRSVPAQNRPYPPLSEVTAHQPTFSLYDVRGSMAGFRCPMYVEGINVPGYHFHFLSEERVAGGHVLEVQTRKVTVEIDYTPQFTLVLPDQREFYEMDFSRNRKGSIEEVER